MITIKRAIIICFGLTACSMQVPTIEETYTDKYVCFGDRMEMLDADIIKTNCLLKDTYDKLLANGEKEEDIKVVIWATQYLADHKPTRADFKDWSPFLQIDNHKSFCSEALGGKNINGEYLGTEHNTYNELRLLRAETQSIWDKSCRFKQILEEYGKTTTPHSYETWKYSYKFGNGYNAYNVCLFNMKDFIKLKDITSQYQALYNIAKEYDDAECPLENYY